MLVNMNIRSNKLYTLTSEFPDDAQAVDRLAEFVASRSGKATEVSLNRLYDVANPSSKLNLAKIIQRFIELGVFKEIYRIELDGIDSAKDFSTIEDIPKVVHDSIRDIDVEVRPKDLRLFYSLKV